jgi:diguanylate cyclase (GGDEF)-like protein
VSKSVAFETSLLKFKRELASNLVFGFFLVCLVGLPISLLRWFSIGYQFVFLHHILITIIVCYSYFRRDKSIYKLDLLIILVLLSSMIISGTLSFGLQTGAAAFSAFCAGLIAIGWGLKRAVLYAAFFGLFLLGMGYLFINQYFDYAVSPDNYSLTYGAWGIVAVGTSLITIFTLISAKQAFNHISALVEQIEVQKQDIEILANTDSMTGYCCNRLSMSHLNQAINVAAREGNKVACVFIDLDNFKQINDQYGHSIGDTVLTEVAARMRSVLREIDIPCRVGGDEFLFILPGIHNKGEIDAILTRMKQQWSQGIEIETDTLYVSGSIGVAVYPDDGQTADDLRKTSDFAMYRSKKNETAI